MKYRSTQARPVYMLVAVCAALLLAAPSISAQQRSGRDTTQTSNSDSTQENRTDVVSELSVGAFALLGFHDATFKSLPPVQNCCTGYTGTNGVGYGVQLAYLMPLGNGSVGIQPRVSWQVLPAHFMTTSTQKIDAGDIKSADGVFEHHLDLTWSTIAFGAEADLALFDRALHLGLGAEGLLVFSGTYEQKEVLISPANVVFSETGTNVRDNRSGALEQYTSLNWNLTGSLRAQLHRDRDATLSGVDIFVRYALPLTALYPDSTVWQNESISYRLAYLVGGVSLVF